MKKTVCKLLALALILCMAVSTLTGCTSLDYRKAVQLYNNRQYEQAADIFFQLGEYEDSSALFTDCHYWDAYDRMQAGNYSEALPRFLKLTNYKDSVQRAAECKYQLAIAAFEAADYTTAQHYFDDLGDYRLTPEYQRQLRWQAFFDYITETAEESGGCYVLSSVAEDRIVNILADSADPTHIILYISWSKAAGYSFLDELTVCLDRSSSVASFEALSDFRMEFGESSIGSLQTGSGTIDLRTYAPGSPLCFDKFEMIVNDNLGQTTTSQDSIDCTMEETAIKNLALLLDVLSAQLAEAGIADIF